MLLLIFVFVLLASIVVPEAVVVILVLNMAAGIFLAGLQIVTALFPRFAPRRKNIDARPFVSILVPSYNEPPVVLMETLEALSRLAYDRFEVLVIDNNTKDPDIWKPVEAFTRVLGEKFRFFHIDNLPGFKAGALNYLIQKVHSESEYAAVIDADYVVEPEFLTTALSYFTDGNIALVQFPQQYRNCTRENRPIADEYRHFFKMYMNMANHLDCVPSTGTISVYTLNVLRHIGGFRREALTEDADVGLRIYAAGYTGVYADQTIGYGFMPYDLEAYRKQKWRWSYGNAQTIKTLFSLFGKISFKSWIGFLSHLTAWDHLNFLPFAALGAYAIVLIPSIPLLPLHKHLLEIASISIFVTLASKLVIFLVALRNPKGSWSSSLRAYLVHIGLTLVYSQTWLELFFRPQSTFERTNKFILNQMPSLIKNSYRELLLGVWFLFGAVEAIVLGRRFITIVAFFVSAFTLFSIYYVYWKIFPTKLYSKKILNHLEHKYRRYLSESEGDIPTPRVV